MSHNQYFGPSGLKAKTLLTDIESLGPIAVDHGRMVYWYLGGLWRSDGESEIHRRAAQILGDRYRPSHVGTILSMIKHREPRFFDNFDTDHLNLPNGLLNWKTGVLTPHNPDVASTIRISTVWQPDATCPAIDTWMSEVFDADTVPLAYSIIGYCLLYDNPLHKAIALYGSGRNGKGTYLRLIEALLGTANVCAVTPQSLDDNRFRAAEMYGKLANLVGDVDPKRFTSTEVFKQLTGGDLVTAERKYGHPFQFKSRATIIAAFNALPRTDDTTEGFFSRWVVIPFTRRFTADVADPAIAEKLHDTSELQGLLVRSVTALRELMTTGHFTLPQTVQAATHDFRRAADPVASFVEDCVTPDATQWIPRGRVYETYAQWCNREGHPVDAAARFYDRLPTAVTDVHGAHVRTSRRDNTRGFVGLTLTSEMRINLT